MAGSRKRLYEEFEGVSDIDHEAKCAKIHGVVASLSPMKSSASGSTNFFDGQLTDGKSNCRVVGFDTKQQQKLEEFREKKEPIALVNCEVKTSKWGSQLEVVVRKNTEVEKSPSKFDVSTLVCAGSNEFALDQLQQLQNYQRVTVTVKVVSLKEKEEVKDGLTKQDCVIGDATGAANLTVWEKNVGALKEGCSYKLSGMMVRTFNGRKYLSMPKENCEIATIADIGNVEEEPVDDACKLEDAVVVGIMLLDNYSSCFICKGKVMVTPDTNLGRCTKCNITVRADRCTQQMSAKLVVESGQTKIIRKILSVFSPLLQEICQSAEVTEESLVTASPFSATYSEQNVITGISRKALSSSVAT